MLPWVYEIWMLPEVCEIMDVARGVRDLEVAFLVRGLDRSVGTLREGSLDPVLLGVCESNLRGDVDISGGVVSLAGVLELCLLVRSSLSRLPPGCSGWALLRFRTRAVWTALCSLVGREEREAALLLWVSASPFCLLLPRDLRADNMVSGIKSSLDVVVEDAERKRTAGASSWV